MFSKDFSVLQGRPCPLRAYLSSKDLCMCPPRTHLSSNLISPSRTHQSSKDLSGLHGLYILCRPFSVLSLPEYLRPVLLSRGPLLFWPQNGHSRLISDFVAFQTLPSASGAPSNLKFMCKSPFHKYTPTPCINVHSNLHYFFFIYLNLLRLCPVVC